MIVLKVKVPSRHVDGKKVWVRAKIKGEMRGVLPAIAHWRDRSKGEIVSELIKKSDSRDGEERANAQRGVQGIFQPWIDEEIELLMKMIPEDDQGYLRDWFLSSRRSKILPLIDLDVPIEAIARDFNEWIRELRWIQSLPATIH